MASPAPGRRSDGAKVAAEFERDQPEVARRVQQAGTGVVLAAKQLRADRLRDAVARARRMTVPSVELSDNARRFADAAEEFGGQSGPAPADSTDPARKI